MLTLPCLFVLEVSLYCSFGCNLIQSRDNFRSGQHRTVTFGRLPTEIGVMLNNRLPDELKKINDPNKYKAHLTQLMVEKLFYFV